MLLSLHHCCRIIVLHVSDINWSILSQTHRTLAITWLISQSFLYWYFHLWGLSAFYSVCHQMFLFFLEFGQIIFCCKSVKKHFVLFKENCIKFSPFVSHFLPVFCILIHHNCTYKGKNLGPLSLTIYVHTTKENLIKSLDTYFL